MIKVNDKVMFKDNYVGYFDDRKGEVFTVAKYHYKDPTVISDMVELKEIEEYHLLSVNNFKKVEVKND